MRSTLNVFLFISLVLVTLPIIVFATNFGYPGELNTENNVFRDCVLMYEDILEHSSYAFQNPAFVEYFREHYQRVGHVSIQGHFVLENVPGVTDFLHALWCSHFLVPTRTDGEPTFYFSDPNNTYIVGGESFRGSGHVSFNNDSGISDKALIGFAGNTCRVTNANEPCAVNEVCVLKASSNTTNAHVASCTQDNYPHYNNYEHTICCTPTEYCRDGIDNTGDGLIDCQSPDCHPSSANNDVPQQCDPGSYIPGNNQSTAECVIDHEIDANGIITPIFSPHCIYSDPNDPFGTDVSYYCNYGYDDNNETHSDGFCCPEGQYYDETLNECQDFQVCGIDESQWCGFSFPLNTNFWLEELFDGGFNWCHSHLPHLTNIQGVTRSEACCPVMTHGTFGYFVVDENVKIFGYE